MPAYKELWMPCIGNRIQYWKLLIYLYLTVSGIFFSDFPQFKVQISDSFVCWVNDVQPWKKITLSMSWKRAQTVEKWAGVFIWCLPCARYDRTLTKKKYPHQWQNHMICISSDNNSSSHPSLMSLMSWSPVLSWFNPVLTPSSCDWTAVFNIASTDT